VKRKYGLWIATACLALSSQAWAQTAWTPAPAGSPKAAVPSHLASLDALAPGSVTVYQRSAAKADGSWELALPDGGRVRVTGLHTQTHGNGDVTWSGYVETAGGNYPVLLTQGKHASFGSFNTPRGRYRLEGWNDRAWVVQEDHAQIELLAPDDGALSVSTDKALALAALNPVAAAAKTIDKVDATQIDVLFIYTAAMAARYPNDAVNTRVNHLVAIANQAFATSDVNAALRLVGVERVDYNDHTSNQDAIDEVRRAIQPGGIPVPGLLNMRTLRSGRGADLVTLIRPHDLEKRGTCGVSYLFENSANLGVNVVSDGFSGWSVCGDETYAHEVGHNLGAQHQNGANNGNAGTATAHAVPGKFHTLMGSFVSGDDERQRVLLRFSNPQQRCANTTCGVAGVSDNAGRVRATMAAVSGYFAATTTTPAVTLPPALDADVDGDGVPESLDAFPFDAAHSSDRDNDGVADALDRFPDAVAESADTDSDGTGDNADTDIDGDGVPNASDALPRLASESADADGDGVGNNADAFDDNRREWGDVDSDRAGDNADPDVDNDGVDVSGTDLLVASLGTDRVLRLDGASGRLIAVEIAESYEPFALGPQSGLAWNSYRRRVDALIAGEIRRYDGASRTREAVVLQSQRRPGVPGLRTGLSAALAVGPDGTLYVADASRLSLHRFDAVTAEELPNLAFGETPFFTLAPRALQVFNNQLFTMESNGRVSVIALPEGRMLRRMQPLGGAGLLLPVDASAMVFGPDNALYIADATFDNVQRMDPLTGQLSAFVAAGSGGLDRPSGLAFDSQGRLYVSSAGTGKVLRYAANGSFSDVFAKVPAGMLADPRSLLFVPHISDRYPRDASRRYRPLAGAWSEPGQTGQGFDIQAMGNSLSVAWYTYDADGRATWYLATGALTGGRLQAPLQRFTWNGTAAVGAVAGELDLNFSAEDRAQLNWKLGTQTGSKTLVHFETADSIETQFPTAIWYAPLSPGWGFSLTRQGGLLAVTAFVFDKAGNPTWAIGAGSADDTEFTMRRLSAPNGCPGCSGNNAPVSAAIGTADFDVIDDIRAAGAIDLQSDTVDWNFDALDLRRLSDTPTKPNGDPR
jgi:hypothetical protein